MDSLVFPSPGPTPLILPRRLSVHGGSRAQRGRYPSSSDDLSATLSLSSPGEDTSQYYYLSTATSNGGHVQTFSPKLIATRPATMHELGQTITGEAAAIDNNGNGCYYTGPTIATIGGQTSRRRHSVSAGSPWTTVPPRHALHMPVMKIDPTIWRNEQHQREIHRLLHEGREEEVMKRRGIRNVMDTTTEEEEEEEGNGMSGVVLTVDFGGFKASEEREKERIRQQVREEWARLVEQQTREYQALLESAARQQAMVDSQRRNSWPWVLGQQQILFKSPTQVLHPQLQQQQQQHPQQIPSQAPAPLQQSQQQQPLMNPSAWSAAPGYAMDARRASFTMYRG